MHFSHITIPPDGASFCGWIILTSATEPGHGARANRMRASTQKRSRNIPKQGRCGYAPSGLRGHAFERLPKHEKAGRSRQNGLLPPINPALFIPRQSPLGQLSSCDGAGSGSAVGLSGDTADDVASAGAGVGFEWCARLWGCGRGASSASVTPGTAADSSRLSPTDHIKRMLNLPLRDFGRFPGGAIVIRAANDSVRERMAPSAGRLN